MGYTKVSWDNVSGNENQPSIVELYWRAMTNEQKASLTVLGFTKETWDDVSGEEETPASLDKAWKKLSVCGENLLITRLLVAPPALCETRP